MHMEIHTYFNINPGHRITINNVEFVHTSNLCNEVINLVSNFILIHLQILSLIFFVYSSDTNSIQSIKSYIHNST